MTEGGTGTESVHAHVHDSSHHAEERHDDGGESLHLWAAQLLSAITMVAVSTLCCLIPVYIARQAQKYSRRGRADSRLRMCQALLSIINCFAAGAFLGLALIHVLPEAVTQLSETGILLVLDGDSSHHSHPYNIAYLLAAVGFTAMLGLEILLGGGHTHCHHDNALIVGSSAPRPGAFVAVPEGALAHSPVPSPRSLPHSSHHHAQHHGLCTEANYCPDCDDCLEAITTVNGMSGERELPGGGSVELPLALPGTPASTPPSVDAFSPVSPVQEGLTAGQQSREETACSHIFEDRSHVAADAAAVAKNLDGISRSADSRRPCDESSDLAPSCAGTSSSVVPSSERQRESCGYQKERTRPASEANGRQSEGCCGQETGCRGTRRHAEGVPCVHAGGCCGAGGGAAKCCHSHSHCPDSDSRIHSGSIGVNVQGGDDLGGRQADPQCSDASAASGGACGSKLSKVLSSAFPCQCRGSSCRYKSVIPPVQLQVSVGTCHGDKCCSNGLGKSELGGLFQRPHESGDRGVVTRESGWEKINGFLRCCSKLEGTKISLALALGVHAIFEGIILGTTQTSQNVWIATLAILGHKGAEAVAVASTLLKMNMNTVPFVVMLAAFIIASPLGILLGAFAATAGTRVSGVFNALAVGAILYAANEMLSEFSGSCSRVRRFVKFLAFVVGLGALFGLNLIHTPYCRHLHSDHGHSAHGATHTHEVHDHSLHH
ncbi:metal cation transporter, ZIP family protein [Toxoplasma gondii MAS]|uniref:Metal cation transporter, ZIP family protein n=1 Tax=Toxoplasma gondii MAS TaxID=943118 RepID=A0A086QMX6_TOXGO|nr:metal cation transporter, ZIP family protein [Toxoplasma gondii MAS]